MPDIADQYDLVSTPKTELKAPAAIDFSLDSPTKKTVHIKGATTGFYLAMSEAYHPQWRLDFNNSKIAGLGSWWPWTKPDAIAESEHIKLNDFQNGWYVDVPKFCAQGLCHQNADGSYDIEMVAEFAPQRWFYVGLIISGATLVGCVTFLVVARRKRKKQMPESLPKLGGSYHGTRRGRKM